MKNNITILLKIGTFHTLITAIYHFSIPFQFRWSDYLSTGIPTINWSLFALNNYFSFNLFVLASFLLYHLFIKKEAVHTIKILSIIILLFWCFSLVYQIIQPMPLPKSLGWLYYLLIFIALANVFIFSKAIIKHLKHSDLE